jgi:uncharacterized protein YndB with AHSA1/START domain
MITLTKSITIAAPAEVIFDILDDPAHMPEIWRNLSNVRNIRMQPNGGKSFEFDYSMAGIRVKGASTALELDRPRRIVTRTTGGVTSTMTWVLEPSPDGSETTVTFEAKYEVPVPLVGRLAEIIVAKINETDIVYVLNGLKIKLEVGDHRAQKP